MGKNNFFVDASAFLESLIKYDTQTRKELQDVLIKATLAIERDAKNNLTQNGSVDTGRLRFSVYSDISRAKFLETEVGTQLSKVGRRSYKSSRGKGEKNKRWNTNVEYAPYVEYGTCRSKAKPFLRPAYNKNIEKMNKKIKKILGGK